MTDNWIPETRSRLAQRRAGKPTTKAGQFWALWPEIKAALDQGQSIRTIQAWLEQDADLVLTVSTLTSYISRSRQRERVRRKMGVEETFIRVHQVPSGMHATGNDDSLTTLPQQAPSASIGNSCMREPVKNPMDQAMQALRKRRLDIREIHGDGDPTSENLI